MKTCNYCGDRVVSDTIPHEGFLYCNDRCLELGIDARLKQNLPSELVSKHALDLRALNCPLCEKDKPLDAYRSHLVYSYLFDTTYNTYTYLSCRRCARKKQLVHGMVTGLIGWFSYSGLFLTPYYFYLNASELFRSEKGEPSESLLRFSRFKLAGHNPDPAAWSPGTPLRFHKMRDLIVAFAAGFPFFSAIYLLLFFLVLYLKKHFES